MKKRLKKWVIILLCIFIQLNSVQGVYASELIKGKSDIAYDEVEENSEEVKEPMDIILEPDIIPYYISAGTDFSYNQNGDKVPWNTSRVNADKLHELGLLGKGINWTIENNINIITMSFGDEYYSHILADEIKRALDNNILIIAAAADVQYENTCPPHNYGEWNKGKRNCTKCQHEDTCHHPTRKKIGVSCNRTKHKDRYYCSTCRMFYSDENSETDCDGSCHLCCEHEREELNYKHTSKGHVVYMRCSWCNKRRDTGSTKAKPDCPSCTTAPSVTIKNLSSDTILGASDTNFKLQILVSDNENDVLTCKYYLNEDINNPVGTEIVNETNPPKIVTFSTGFSALTLKPGKNKITVEVRDSIAPVGKAEVTFYVDLQAPNITECKADTTYSSAKITVTATDISLPIEYRYTLAQQSATEWLRNSTYTFNNLTPNTTYTYKVEAKDKKENIASVTKTFMTKAQAPTVVLKAQNNNSIKLDISTLNPLDTLYKIKVGDKYLSSDGILSNTIVWMKLPTKTTLIKNLEGNKEYKVIVYAQNKQDNTEVASQEYRIKTTPLAPTGLVITGKTNNSISLIWNASAGAYAYDLLRETLSVDGVITEVVQIDNIFATSYVDTGLLPYQLYIYQIRSKLNPSTYGNWSGSLIDFTLPNIPEKVSGLNAILESSNINLSWAAQDWVIGYEVLINNQLSLYTQDSTISIPFTTANEQCTLAVRSFNIYDVNNPADETKWSNEGEWSEALIIYTSANSPKDIVINNITYESVQFTWDKNNNPDSVLYQCELYNNDNLIKQSGEISTNAYSFSGLEPQTQYTLKIWAINSNKIRSIAAEHIINTTPPLPTAPGQLRATVRDKQINLLWDHSDRAVNYTIKRDGNIIVDKITDNKYLDTGLLPENTYTYEVIACNEYGTMSSSITLKTKGEAPATPAILSHNSSNTSIQIVWNEVNDATGYDIKCDGVIFNTELNTVFEHKGLLPGSMHTYSVRARSIHGSSEWSSPKTFKTIPAAPVMPDGIVFTATHSKITLSWNAVKNADSYTVNVDGIEITGITIPEYTHIFDPSVPAESEHVIRIMAVNQGGNSGYTAPLSITLLPFINAPDVTGIVEDSVIKLSWSPVDDAIGYEIELDYSAITTVSAITTSHIDTQSSLNQPHTYRVRAIFDGSFGDWSYVVTVKAIPSAPSEVIGNAKQNTITVQWNNCDWAIIYELLADDEIIYTGPNTEFTHSSLLYNSAHTYSVRAGNQSGYSEWSSPITVTTEKEITNIPQNIKVSRESQNSVIVTWDSVKNASGYMVKINGEQTQTVVVPMISISTVPQANYTVCVAAMIESGRSILLGEWSPEVTFQGPVAISDTPVFGDIKSNEYSIELSWNNVINARGYEIEIDNDNIVRVYTNTYCDSNIPARTTRNYRIRSFNESGVSEWSDSISATTNDATPGVPINIICKNGVSTIGSSVIIDWDDVKDASSYEVIDSNGKIYTSSESTITIDGLESGTTYQFQVRAITIVGQSPKGNIYKQGPWSSPVSFVTDIKAPSNIVASNTEAGNILLSWDASNGATKYEIEMDGVVIGTTEETCLVIEQASPYLTHSFRVRALNTIKSSNWTEPLVYNQNIPIHLSIGEGEKISVLMPVSNVKNISKYKMTIIIDTNDLGLIDAFEFTPELDTTTTYIKDYDMQIIVENVENLCYISFIVNNESMDQITGILNSIKLIGKNTCNTEIRYNVSIFR